MRITILTNEYPPHVYGGAGVHVDYLSQELAKIEEGKNKIHILCFGDQREYAANLTVEGVPLIPVPSLQELSHQKLLDTLFRNVIMAGSVKETDIVHCHTWYTHLAGCFVKNIYHVPLVLTSHSLEPQRPWKEEQLGPAYRASTWIEKTAYQNADGIIAVSRSMKMSIHECYEVNLEKTKVIPNGIDVDQYRRVSNPQLLASYQINPDKPFILFVGRITRQKGIIHLIRAIPYISSGVQIVLCAGAPDTEEIGKEMTKKVEEARAQTRNEIIWIRQWVPRSHIVVLYSHASLFICPSIYEPFGIINIEAMACETPVVASAVGGIPEVVVHDETGLLVPFEPIGPNRFEPRDPERFSKDLAEGINRLLSSPEKIKTMGTRSRERVEKHFSWKSIARQTLDFYKKLTDEV
jgi:starch synthase